MLSAEAGSGGAEAATRNGDLSELDTSESVKNCHGALREVAIVCGNVIKAAM
jgi:hypothetical protein